jgi:hypothetical protein
VAIVDRALRITFPDAPHQAAPALQTTYWQQAPMGIGKPRPAWSRLRVKTPNRTIVPLSVDEVARFWSSYHGIWRSWDWCCCKGSGRKKFLI